MLQHEKLDLGLAQLHWGSSSYNLLEYLGVDVRQARRTEALFSSAGRDVQEAEVAAAVRLAIE